MVLLRESFLSLSLKVHSLLLLFAGKEWFAIIGHMNPYCCLLSRARISILHNRKLNAQINNMHHLVLQILLV